jgi:hypothetical protein
MFNKRKKPKQVFQCIYPAFWHGIWSRYKELNHSCWERNPPEGSGVRSDSVLRILAQMFVTIGHDVLKSLRSWDFISLADKSKNF